MPVKATITMSSSLLSGNADSIFEENDWFCNPVLVDDEEITEFTECSATVEQERRNIFTMETDVTSLDLTP